MTQTMKAKKTEAPKTEDAAPVKQAKHKTKAAAKGEAAKAKESKSKSKGKYNLLSPAAQSALPLYRSIRLRETCNEALCVKSHTEGRSRGRPQLLKLPNLEKPSSPER